MESNCLWISAGREDEVKLKVPLPPVVDQISAGIDFCVGDAPIRPDSRMPSLGIPTDEIVRAPLKLVRGSNNGRGVCALQGHPNCLRRAFPVKAWRHPVIPPRLETLPRVCVHLVEGLNGFIRLVERQLGRVCGQEKRVAGAVRNETDGPVRLADVGFETQG